MGFCNNRSDGVEFSINYGRRFCISGGRIREDDKNNYVWLQRSNGEGDYQPGG